MNSRIIDIIHAVDGVCNIIFRCGLVVVMHLYFKGQHLNMIYLGSKIFYIVWAIGLLGMLFIPSLETLKVMFK